HGVQSLCRATRGLKAARNRKQCSLFHRPACCRIREDSQSVTGLLRKLTRTHTRFCNRTMAIDEGYGVRQIFIFAAETSNGLLPELALFRVPARIGENNRQGHFSFAEIVPLVLAH